VFEFIKNRFSLIIGGLAAILASTCCLGPLLLITLGVSGAWISNLTLLEAYRPFFIIVALIALFFAWRKIWRSSASCTAEAVCNLSEVKTSYKWLFWMVAILVLIAVGFPFGIPIFY
jgi:mercuric ion transport protein